MLDWLAALVKAVGYGAALSAAGAALIRVTLLRKSAWRDYDRKLSRIAGVALVCTVLAGEAILVLRLGGYWDLPTLTDIFGSPLGVALALQVIGGAWLARGTGRVEGLLPAILVLATFAVSGHAPAQNWVLGVVVSLHVCAAAWWAGGLWVLRRACGDGDTADLADMTRRFSIQAIWVVAGLVLAGIATAAVLLHFSVDLSRAYDRVLVLKLALVLALLTAAARNKLLLTPRLKAEARARHALRRSINFELACFGLIALTTAYLTTFTSPHDAGQTHRMMGTPPPNTMDRGQRS